MPTNVTAEYKKAKAAFQQAREPAERLACLKEMLRTLPKHKGTEHLQADIKSRIKELTDELAGPKKGAAKKGPVYTVRPDGAAQVVIIGPPNSGKSSLHVQLTGSQAEVGPYPHTTQVPTPGMLPYEDVNLQLIDLPPVSATYMEPWMPNALQPALAALLVVDLSIAGCLDNVVSAIERLKKKRVHLIERWPRMLDGTMLIPGTWSEEELRQANDGAGDLEEDEEDLFRVDLPTLLVINKCDSGVDEEEVQVFEELMGIRFPALAVSVKTGAGVDRIGPLLYHGLGIVRIYTKIPGKPPDLKRPYTLFAGGTVLDAARLVHREMAETIKYARIWGSAKFEGQQVGRDYVLSDKDILELHG